MKELDPDPDSEKLLDPDTQKMNVDPQPWAQLHFSGPENLLSRNYGIVILEESQ